IPMMDFSVVVLPAPLRPSNVTTSLGFTTKLTPCRTWLSPYQASRSRTASSGVSASAGSDICRSDIGLDHPRVFRHRGIIALRQHLATGEHRDRVRKRGDDREVVLDHQDGAV